MSLAALAAAQPLLRAVRTAGEALGLAPLQLLHAGPPLRDPRRPPPVLLSAAVMTLLQEGWAGSQQEAEALVRTGRATLEPAQPRGCVTPLALVVSAGVPLFEVEAQGQVVHAPLPVAGGPDTRMGSRDADVPARLVHRDRVLAPALQRLLGAHGALPLLPIAAAALAAGDDLHSRTTAATARLLEALGDAGEGVGTREVGNPVLPGSASMPMPSQAQALDACLRRHDAGRDGDVLVAALRSTPLFFLTPWMAASAALLRLAEGGEVPTLVTRAGGNGEQFGIALAGRPQQWIGIEAGPPVGQRLRPGTAVAPAIGDSAVIDMLGCGGLALAGAPEPCEAFAGYLPADHASRAARLLRVHHPGLHRPVGLDAAKVVSERCPPLVALAMLAADGQGGFAGRGLYEPPLGLFEQAVRSLQQGG